MNKHKILGLAVSAGVLGLAIALILVMQPADPDNRNAGPAGDEPEQDSQPTTKTIGSEWRWQNTDTGPSGSPDTSVDEQTAEETSPPFDVAAIYDKLQTVELDEHDNVVLDERALRALEETLDHSDIELTQAGLDELQELIRIGLPGKAGQQTARIVKDYYEYIGARDEFNALYDSTQHSDPDALRAQYEELQALRELYLGPEAADQLFAQRDRESRHMLESMLVEQDEELTEEEKKARQEEIAERYQPEQPDIINWESRYSAFLQQKQSIENAQLTPEEETRQINQWLEDNFTPEERREAERQGLLETSE